VLSLGNISVPNRADKISISRVHKTFYNSKRKMSKDINREIRGKNKVKMANRYVKRCPISPVSRKIEIKTSSTLFSSSD